MAIRMRVKDCEICSFEKALQGQETLRVGVRVQIVEERPNRLLARTEPEPIRRNPS